MKSATLSSKDPISQYFVAMNLLHWTEVMAYIQKLPYGRNSNRTELDLVFFEKKGTCSSKHAFLKKLADLNKIPHIKLILSIYKMNQKNTSRIGKTLAEYNIDYLPEAHCYLKINGHAKDLTTIDSNIEAIQDDILFEEEITPKDVIHYKVAKHKSFIKNWIKENNIQYSFDKIWGIREQCIKNIEDHHQLSSYPNKS